MAKRKRQKAVDTSRGARLAKAATATGAYFRYRAGLEKACKIADPMERMQRTREVNQEYAEATGWVWQRQVCAFGHDRVVKFQIDAAPPPRCEKCFTTKFDWNERLEKPKPGDQHPKAGREA